jgi:hypothetical protein
LWRPFLDIPTNESKSALACDGEAKQFANDFVAVFAATGWKEVRAGTHYAYDVDPVGVQIILNSDDVKAHRIPPAANALPTH